jgi:pimeloyl-ACP methyl ester carboxylesterase
LPPREATASHRCSRSTSSATGRTPTPTSRTGHATTSQRIEPERAALLDRLARSVPVALEQTELDELADRSIEPVEGGWRFRWDRRVLATEPADPFAFLENVDCPVQVMAGAASDVMPPRSAGRFAAAIQGATLELIDGVGHHVELQAPDRVALAIRAALTPR